MLSFPEEPRPSGGGGSIMAGFGVAAGINLGAALVGVVTLTAFIGIVILIGIGVLQLAWLLPLYFHYRKQGATEKAKGVLIAAGITFLLNAGCWGLVSSGPMR